MKEAQLIFLISQPRSGSSMLQQLLLASDKIISAPEPWFMLPLIYSYKETRLEGEYNPKFSQINLMGYLKSVDNGLDIFKQKIKKLALDVYQLKFNSNYSFFLDKTPRYYHVIDELQELFPKARFIFLTRNPLSVFASILAYNFNGNTKAMFSDDRKDDIFKAIPLLVKQKNNLLPNSFFVNYEHIIEQPVRVMEDLFRFLNLEIPENIGKYEVKGDFASTIWVDQKGLKKHSQPVSEYKNAWKQSIDTLQKKYLALDYINSIPDEYISVLGYDKEQILNELKVHKVRKTYFNVRLNYYTKFQYSKKYFIINTLNSWLYD